MITFNVSYDVITPESAEQRDYAESGFAGEGVRLREAIELMGGVAYEAVDDSFRNVEWGHGTAAYYREGRSETRTLHVPSNVTSASYERIRRLLGNPRRY